MHAHAKLINPNAQLDALYSAERAAAKREATRTRKKLLEFASEIAAEAESGEACVVRLEGGEDSQAETNQQGSGKKQTETPGEEDVDNSISQWA